MSTLCKQVLGRDIEFSSTRWHNDFKVYACTWSIAENTSIVFMIDACSRRRHTPPCWHALVQRLLASVTHKVCIPHWSASTRVVGDTICLTSPVVKHFTHDFGIIIVPVSVTQCLPFALQRKLYTPITRLPSATQSMIYTCRKSKYSLLKFTIQCWEVFLHVLCWKILPYYVSESRDQINKLCNNVVFIFVAHS